MRDIFYYDDDESNYEAFCIRKVDDDLLCEIWYTANEPKKSPEYFESLFEEIK